MCRPIGASAQAGPAPHPIRVLCLGRPTVNPLREQSGRDIWRRPCASAQTDARRGSLLERRHGVFQNLHALDGLSDAQREANIEPEVDASYLQCIRELQRAQPVPSE